MGGATGKPIERVNWARIPITIHVVEFVLPKTGVVSLNYVAGYAVLLVVALTGVATCVRIDTESPRLKWGPLAGQPKLADRWKAKRFTACLKAFRHRCKRHNQQPGCCT